MNKKQTIKIIFKHLKGYWYLLLLSIIIAIICNIAILRVPIYIGKSIDNIISENNINIQEIMNNIIIIIVLVIIASVLQYVLSIINNKIAYNVSYDIRKESFSKIHKLPISYIDSHSYGDIVSRLISDVETFSDGLLMGFSHLFTGVVTIVGTLILMLTINWFVAIIVIILTPLSLFVAKFIAKNTYKYFAKQSVIKGKQTAFIDEMVNNLKVVQAFSHEKENQIQFNQINKELETCSIKAIFFSSIVNPTTRFINALIYAIVALSGALIIINPSYGMALTVGELSVLLTYANQYSKPFNEISSVISEFEDALACAARIFSFNNETEMVNNETIDLNEAKGNIEMKSVYFSYDSNQRLIEDLNVRVMQGQKIAIVGPTGCGKTTLINLLMRFYDPVSGEILIDNKSSITITKKSLRNNFGMVLQDTWLKSATILENLKMGKDDATDEEVMKACKEAHAHNFIMRLKYGYQTIIGEDGGSLSAGQKQLLCIARIMLVMPPILILDEATSSIDTRTELKIQNAFHKLMENKTSFIVAHRLSTIQNADLILVMKDGNIIEKGSHNELMIKKGFYYSLYNSQFEN